MFPDSLTLPPGLMRGNAAACEGEEHPGRLRGIPAPAPGGGPAFLAHHARPPAARVPPGGFRYPPRLRPLPHPLPPHCPSGGHCQPSRRPLPHHKPPHCPYGGFPLLLRRKNSSPDEGPAGRLSMAGPPWRENSPRRGFVGTHPTRRVFAKESIGKEEKLEPAGLTAAKSGQAGVVTSNPPRLGEFSLQGGGGTA
jgi:hypothetical protein